MYVSIISVSNDIQLNSQVQVLQSTFFNVN